MTKDRRALWGLMMVLAFSIAIMGCSALRSKNQKTAASPAPPRETGQKPLYYDFGDVLIPTELKVNEDKSFVFRTPGLVAGVLALKGRVEVNSLIAFFENNMAKDNWRQVSAFKSPRSMMLFQKENRWCVISITDQVKLLNTEVEIWVSPTMGFGESRLIQ
jgi:hypothetical protein